MAIDPICKMEVDEATAKFTSEFKGNTYYFCAPGCKAEFEANPEKYVWSQEMAGYPVKINKGILCVPFYTINIISVPLAEKKNSITIWISIVDN